MSGADSGPERLAHELERVAQPLAGDPQVVERLDVGPAQDRLVARGPARRRPRCATAPCRGRDAARPARPAAPPRPRSARSRGSRRPSAGSRPSRARGSSSTSASSRWARQSARSGSRARCSVTGRSARYWSAASSRTSRSRTAPSRAAVSRRPLRNRFVRAARNDVPKTRHAARWRRVATRIAWSSVWSLPARVPASRASIRARWKRMTLRPGLGDVVVAGDARGLADRQARGVGRWAPARSSSTSSEVVGR